ncbi:MAG: hypothetical protein K0U16_07550 [Gammaproteobacteria bacterium]|nr:hypothetical protein [Gammaproteobacteria bacterium]
MATELKSEAQVLDALRNRFPPPEWALFPGVSNGTGRNADRWADAVAMNLWPSRGLEILGFEVKVSRGDMLRELKKPQKAEVVARHCDKWFIAVGSKSIVKPEELPRSWGLLVPTGSAKGQTMKIVKDALSLRKKTADPKVSRSFCAAVLRRASEKFDEPRLRADIRREIYNEVIEDAQKIAEGRLQHQVDELRRLYNESKSRANELQESLSKLTEHPAMTQHIVQAIALLHHLRGWQGARSQATNILRGVETDKDRLDQIGATMKLVIDLCSEVGIGGEQ